MKRVHESADASEGFRVLVDRISPRGLTKPQVQAAAWLKGAAPSTALRRWFGHEPRRWDAFKVRYFAELRARPGVVSELIRAAAQGRVTLLYSARDPEHNQAVALPDYLVAVAEKDDGRLRS